MGGIVLLILAFAAIISIGNSKPEANEKGKPNPKADPHPKPKSKPEPKPEPRPKAKAKPHPKPKAKPEPKAEPKPEPKPVPKPKAEAKAEPKPKSKAKAKPQWCPGCSGIRTNSMSGNWNTGHNIGHVGGNVGDTFGASFGGTNSKVVGWQRPWTPRPPPTWPPRPPPAWCGALPCIVHGDYVPVPNTPHYWAQCHPGYKVDKGDFESITCQGDKYVSVKDPSREVPPHHCLPICNSDKIKCNPPTGTDGTVGGFFKCDALVQSCTLECAKGRVPVKPHLNELECRNGVLEDLCGNPLDVAPGERVCDTPTCSPNPW